jgi:hypothetical protein
MMGGMDDFTILECGVNKNKLGDVDVINVRLRRISATIVAIEKQ